MNRLKIILVFLSIMCVVIVDAQKISSIPDTKIDSTTISNDSIYTWSGGIPYFTGFSTVESGYYEVDNIGEISNNDYPVGSKICSKGIDSLGTADYIVESDSITGWENDGYLVVPTNNGNYAIINPNDKVLRPRYAGAIVNDGISDTEAENRMFEFIEVTKTTDRKWNVIYDPGTYTRGVRDTVFIANQWDTNNSSEGDVFVHGYNARITVDSFAIGHYLKSNDDPSTPGTTSFKLNYQGFMFKGDAEDDRSKGTFFAGVCRSEISNLKYEGLDTAMVNSFALGNNYHDIWFSLNNSVNMWNGADNIHKAWSGSTNQNAAFNVNRIHGVRVFGLAGAHSHIELYAGGGNSIKDIISEGAEPEINIIIDEDFVPVFYGNIIENVHLEDQGTGGICIDARKIMGTLRLTDVYKATTTGTDTIFKFDDGGTGYFIVDNVTFPYQRVDGTLDIRSTPKSSAPTYPYTTWFSNNIIGYDRRFVKVSNSRNLINLGTIAGEQETGDKFGYLTLVGSLHKYDGYNGAQRLGNTYTTLGASPWLGVYTYDEGFIIDQASTGGFGFEKLNSKVRGSGLSTGPADNRFAYDDANNQMYWNFTTQGKNMLLDSIGYLRLHKYGQGSFTPSALGKTTSNYISIFATDGTVLEQDVNTVFYRDSSLYISNENITFNANILDTLEFLSITSRVNSSSTQNNTITLPDPADSLVNTRIVVYSDDLDNGVGETYDTEILAHNLYKGNQSIADSIYVLAGGETIELICIPRATGYIWELTSTWDGWTSSNVLSNTSQTIEVQRKTFYTFTNTSTGRDTLDPSDLETGDQIQIDSRGTNYAITNAIYSTDGQFSWDGQTLDSLYMNYGTQHLTLTWNGVNFLVSGDKNMSGYTGYAEYVDTLGRGGSTRVAITGGDTIHLPNLAHVKYLDQIPLDIDSMYTSADSLITGRDGDGLTISIEFDVRAATANTTSFELWIDIGGTVRPLYSRRTGLTKGNGIVQSWSFSYSGRTGDTWEANGGKVMVTSDEDIEITGDVVYLLTRTHKAR